MPRFRITIEYDGTSFVGWQVQPDGPTIQGQLIDAIYKLSGERVTVRGAGRTDSGVHALGQVAHFDLQHEYTADAVRNALNFHLKPDPIAIVAASIVPATFDARFSATQRHYRYRILNRRAPPVLQRERVWWVARPLDAGRMAEAASVLVGRHDFTTFRAAGCQAKSPVKNLDRFAVTVVSSEIHIEASAQSFMHNQVRSMVGSLKLVGEGRWTSGDLAAALAACDRARCGPVAPPTGLYLTSVDYADQPQTIGGANR
jgi:tRNA pseudouridine38-40 synthase